jgi:hypothetical protein
MDRFLSQPKDTTKNYVEATTLKLPEQKPSQVDAEYLAEMKKQYEADKGQKELRNNITGFLDTSATIPFTDINLAEKATDFWHGKDAYSKMKAEAPEAFQLGQDVGTVKDVALLGLAGAAAIPSAIKGGKKLVEMTQDAMNASRIASEKARIRKIKLEDALMHSDVGGMHGENRGQNTISKLVTNMDPKLLSGEIPSTLFGDAPRVRTSGDRFTILASGKKQAPGAFIDAGQHRAISINKGALRDYLDVDPKDITLGDLESKGFLRILDDPKAQERVATMVLRRKNGLDMFGGEATQAFPVQSTLKNHVDYFDQGMDVRELWALRKMLRVDQDHLNQFLKDNGQ